MAKRPTPNIKALAARERILLFCIGSGADWQRAGVTNENVTTLVVKGLLTLLSHSNRSGVLTLPYHSNRSGVLTRTVRVCR
jgi:hypothetical protein